MTLRRVNDSIVYPVGSLGAANPTDAPNIYLATLPFKVYIFLEACLLRISVPLSSEIWAPPGALFYAYSIPAKEIDGFPRLPRFPLFPVVLGDLFPVVRPHSVDLIFLLHEQFHMPIAKVLG